MQSLSLSPLIKHTKRLQLFSLKNGEMCKSIEEESHNIKPNANKTLLATCTEIGDRKIIAFFSTAQIHTIGAFISTALVDWYF
jgi:hypothetical protein